MTVCESCGELTMNTLTLCAECREVERDYEPEEEFEDFLEDEELENRFDAAGDQFFV